MRSLDEVPHSARRGALAMRAELLAQFPDGIAAIWLYGSNVFGYSGIDIDLHVLLREYPDDAQTQWLRELDRRVTESEGVGEIDCWYITLDAARGPDQPRDLRHTNVRDLHWSLHCAHWLAGACVVVHGISPLDVLPTPTWPELEATLRQEIEDAGRYLADGTAYWTLQLCRVLASLETRDVVRSKLDSADWELDHLPPSTHPAITAASRYYHHTPQPGDPELIRAGYPNVYAAVRGLIRNA